MFQTEINHWLQSFPSDVVTFFMINITRMGYQNFFTLVFVVIMFGINFRKGFYLAQLLIINYALTELLKNLFALPRPSDADSSLKLFIEKSTNPSPFYKMGAKSFFSLPPQEVINYYRSVPGYSFGLPSGHVSSTTVLWGSLYFLFKKNWIKIIGIIIIFLMTISRMYLAKHFLADVIGGFIVGSIVVAFGYYGILKNDKIDKLILYENIFTFKNVKRIIWLLYLLGFPFVLLLIPSLNFRISAALLGINTGYIILSFKSIPSDMASIIKRIARIVLAIVVFILLSFILKFLINYFNIVTGFTLYIEAFLTTMLMVILTVKLGVKFKFYELNKTSI